MKRYLLFLLLFSVVSLNAQRLVREDCIGTPDDELILKINKNNDSSTTYLISTENKDDSYYDVYSLKLLKLNSNKEVIINRKLDVIFGGFHERNVAFDEDGSFLIVFPFLDTLINQGSNIVKAFKFDKNGNYLWSADSIAPYDYYLNEPSIIKTGNGGYILKQSYANGFENKILCINHLGQFQWQKSISLNTLLPTPSFPDYSLNVFPLKNNNTIISYSITSRTWVGFPDSSVKVISLINIAGDEIKSDTIGSKTYSFTPASVDFRNVNFYFDYNLKPDASFVIERKTYDGTDLSLIRTDSLYNLYEIYPVSNTIATVTDTCNFFSLPMAASDTVVYCKNLQNQLLWSYPYTNAQFNNGIYTITDNYSILVNKTYISNGVKKWESNADLNDTIYYKHKYWKSRGKSIASYNSDYYYSIAYTDTVCVFCSDTTTISSIIVLQLIDMGTGLVKEKMIIEPKTPYCHAEYYDKGKTLIIGNTDNICRYGNYDTYMAYYENKFNTINGIVYVDNNNNNSKDNNEPLYPYGYATTLSIRDTQTQHLNANYPVSFFTDSGIYTTKVHLYNDYYSIAPPQFTTSHHTYDNNDTLFFALHPVSIKNDISMQLINNWMTRLGQNNAYTVSVENKGTGMANGKVKVLMDARLLNITSSPNYTYRNGDTIVWNIGNLAPLQKGQAIISFTAETPTALNAGDTLISKAWYESDSTDVTPADNYTELKETIRASYDPNEKAITSGETLTPQQVSNGAYISYIIHFQNKGNDTAFKVIILDTLSENIDINSLQIINASKPYTLEIIGKKILKFTFDNIRLSYDTTNVSSTGYIAYKVKPLNTLAAGNTVQNTAEIFFDYNAPIRTNTVETEVLLLSAAHPNRNMNGNMTIYPNPNMGIFTIRYDGKSDATVQLQMTDITGNIIYNENRQHQNKTEFTINESNLAKGIYWIKLTDGKDSYSNAVIVQ